LPKKEKKKIKDGLFFITDMPNEAGSVFVPSFQDYATEVNIRLSPRH
jgi:hypothetical protein